MKEDKMEKRQWKKEKYAYVFYNLAQSVWHSEATLRSMLWRIGRYGSPSWLHLIF
jgi:hypothetical protein